MNEIQQIPTSVDKIEAEPEDPSWYLQRMYDMAVEPIEVGVEASGR
ncbi:MAG TPA: hypothetical protein VNT01_05615 [Symbiobacteriaceae bacterium]|nr:hypothetical protein [Symbiobacteriaceae bacterium]